MTLGWLHIAALLGAIQGVFLTVVLATQRRNRTANRLLAAAMFAFSLYMATAVYHAAGWEQVAPHFFGLAYPTPIVFGPLFYLYAVTASDRNRGLRWRDALHFLPFVVLVLASLPVYLMSGAEKLAFYQDLLRGIRTPLIRVFDPLKFISGIAYTTVTLIFLLRHRSRVKDNYSSIERVNLHWLLVLSGSVAAIWALATLFELLGLAGDDYIALAIAVLVYAIGYMALRQPEIFNFAAQNQVVPSPAPMAVPAEPVAATAPMPEPGPPAASRYQRSGLTEREAAALKRSLVAAMETDRLYQNTDLTLGDLATRLKTTAHKLSEVLNSEIGQTFYDFVNTYRVRDVERRIADERFQNLTILSLAMEAGFASKATFNHVFRKHTGQTPSAFRKSLSR
jgi:AraC-like DNA-binding protein